MNNTTSRDTNDKEYSIGLHRAIHNRESIACTRAKIKFAPMVTFNIEKVPAESRKFLTEEVGLKDREKYKLNMSIFCPEANEYIFEIEVRRKDFYIDENGNISPTNDLPFRAYLSQRFFS